MAKYTPRLKEPSKSDKNYIHYSDGGYNRCIEIANGSCLPNCVGYSWARWREILEYNPKLSTNNAENWYGYTADGYKRGKTPKLGAVICWRKGEVGKSSDGCGHVAIVEQIKANGDIVCSESVYDGARFRVKTYTKSSNYYLANGYVFQGFIYLPLEFEEEKKEEVVLYKTGDYRVTADVLNVRTGPGTNYDKKSFAQLTKNAQAQVKKACGYEANGYVKGVECTISQVKGSWGKTPSGWICLDYCKKI